MFSFPVDIYSSVKVDYTLSARFTPVLGKRATQNEGHGAKYD